MPDRAAGPNAARESRATALWAEEEPRITRSAPADHAWTAHRAVPLVELDGDLVPDLSTAAYESLRRELVVPVLDLPRGPWRPPAELGRAIALLVVDGLLTCEETLGGNSVARILGPGDAIDARRLADRGKTWHARTGVEVAVLDARLLVAARRWPQLALGWTRRLLDGSHELEVLAAVRGLSRIEDRLVAYLTHVASRWGRVTPDGYAIDLPATHELLGRLVAAQRPTVSLALTSLRADGRLRRLDDGRWLVRAPDAAPARLAPALL